MKKINVVHIVKNLRTNGISNVVMNYCKKINKSKFNVTIIAGNPISDKYREECKNNEITLIEIPSKTINGPLKSYSKLHKYLKNNKFDIAHIHGNSRTVTLELIICMLCGIKNRIVHSHSTSCDNRFIHFIFKPLFNLLCTYEVSCSDEAGKWMFNNNDYKVLPNGFDTSKFIFDMKTRIELRRKLNIPLDSYVIGHVGLFVESKNHKFIINTFNKLCELNNNVYLLLIGEGPDEKVINELIEKSPYKNKIINYGVCYDINKMYNIMDCFIFPSIYEGLGIALIEAQINGLNCIVSSSISPLAYVTDNVCSLSLNCDSDIWIEKLLEQKNIDRNNIIDNYNDEIQYYDINNNVNLLENIYYEINNK